MTLLAVIPCLNEVENIERITRQLISDEAVNAIAIVDGGSTDGTLDIVSSLIAESPKVSLIVVVPMKTVGREGFQIAIATAQNSIIGTGGSAHRGQSQGQWVEHGHHALMRIGKFIDVGGYCEAMPCNEDAELDHRLILAGARIWLEPDATIVYFPRTTAKSLWIQYYKYGIGRACNLQRHRMKPRLRQLVPLAVPCAALLLLLSPLHWLFAAPFLFWLGLCLGLGTIIGGRQAEAVGCLSGIAAAIMHFSWAIGFFKQIIFRPKGVAARYGFPAETSYNLD